jgi:hypothetical protein
MEDTDTRNRTLTMDLLEEDLDDRYKVLDGYNCEAEIGHLLA